jgi:NAD-dependent deacetylase
MESSPDPDGIQTAARLIKEARLAVVFTGAGLSTASGIPDFRGTGDSLWNQTNPMESASLTVFHDNPHKFFDWLLPLAKKMATAHPNAAHQAISDLEKGGYIKAVITQNIDNLHQAAGCRHVLELHGTALTATCSSCRMKYKGEDYLPEFIQTGNIPHCSTCGGILKPDIVLYEELLPTRTWAEAEQFSQNCDLMIVAGSSLEVVPAATLPLMAARNGAELILINRTPTHLDSVATVVLNDDVTRALPEIARIVL